MNTHSTKNNLSGIKFSTGFNSPDIYLEPGMDRRRATRHAKNGKVNKKYFEDLMREQGLSMRGLAKIMGLGHSQLSLALSGNRKFSVSEVAELSKIFGRPVHSIIENIGVPIPPIGARRAKVVGVAHGDGLVAPLGANMGELVTAPDHLPHRAIAVQVRTAGTAAEWLDGAIMFCSEPEGIDPACMARLCLVKIQGGPLVVARVGRGYAPETYSLTGMFAQEDTSLEWATPILFMKN